MMPKRALFTFHHILTSRKIASLQEWSRELNLVGILKTGYPGVVLVAGPQSTLKEQDTNPGERAIQDYVRRVKRLRWQTCSVKATETTTRENVKALCVALDGGNSHSSVYVADTCKTREEFRGLLHVDSMKEITHVLRIADGLDHHCLLSKDKQAQANQTKSDWEAFYSQGMRAP